MTEHERVAREGREEAPAARPDIKIIAPSSRATDCEDDSGRFMPCLTVVEITLMADNCLPKRRQERDASWSARSIRNYSKSRYRAP
jgi:hypothetical protein